MEIYKKIYTRENCLIAIQIWEEHQVHRLKQMVGTGVPLSIFDAHDGVVGVYYCEDIWDVWGGIITRKIKNDPQFVRNAMQQYGEQLDILEKIWHRKKLASVKELLDFYNLVSSAWVGLSISYNLPDLKGVTRANKDLGMALRQRSADFLELTDHVIVNTMRRLFPDLGDLVKYIAIEEIEDGNVPSEQELKERQRHYIYFDFKVYTRKDLLLLANENRIEIQEVVTPKHIKEIKGQTAMAGKVKGKVRVVNKKSEIPMLRDGEILVTAMTTPDYLPAMRKAAAFVTDEGGITCHAAIVAREIGKPCVIGTKIATKVLKTGNTVIVDADKGIVTIQ